jgi:hypothetical protein
VCYADRKCSGLAGPPGRPSASPAAQGGQAPAAGRLGGIAFSTRCWPFSAASGCGWPILRSDLVSSVSDQQQHATISLATIRMTRCSGWRPSGISKHLNEEGRPSLFEIWCRALAVSNGTLPSAYPNSHSGTQFIQSEELRHVRQHVSLNERVKPHIRGYALEKVLDCHPRGELGCNPQEPLRIVSPFFVGGSV